LSAFVRTAESRTAPTVILQKKIKIAIIKLTAQHSTTYIYTYIIIFSTSQIHNINIHTYTQHHISSPNVSKSITNPSKRVRNFSSTNTNRSQSIPTSSHVINDLDRAYPTDGGAGKEDCYLRRMWVMVITFVINNMVHYKVAKVTDNL